MDDDQLNMLLEKVATAWHDVMALYGDAMLSAQVLEGELAWVLGALQTKIGALKDSDFDWAYEQMRRAKALDLLNLIRGSGGNLSADNLEVIRKAIYARNFLAHRFFHQYSPITGVLKSRQCATKLRKIKSELQAAHRLLLPLRLKLEGELGLSEERKAVDDDFWKRTTQAILSFDDE
jgi:hypothetical protein